MADAEWIKARLTGKHGEKAQIAAMLGMESQTFSKVLSGVRRLTADEAERLRIHFGEAPTSDEKAFLDALRKVPRERHPEIMRYLHFLASDGV